MDTQHIARLHFLANRLYYIKEQRRANLLINAVIDNSKFPIATTLDIWLQTDTQPDHRPLIVVGIQYLRTQRYNPLQWVCRTPRTPKLCAYYNYETDELEYEGRDYRDQHYDLTVVPVIVNLIEFFGPIQITILNKLINKQLTKYFENIK